MIKITKVKVKERPLSINIFYKERNSKGLWDEKQLTSRDEPLPSFIKAMQGMIPHLIENCELPQELEVGTAVTGVSISWLTKSKIDDAEALEQARHDLGCVIVGQRRTVNAEGNINLVSPHKRAVDTSNESYQLSKECVEAMHTVINEAEKYLAGERSQGDLLVELNKQGASND